MTSFLFFLIKRIQIKILIDLKWKYICLVSIYRFILLIKFFLYSLYKVSRWSKLHYAQLHIIYINIITHMDHIVNSFFRMTIFIIFFIIICYLFLVFLLDFTFTFTYNFSKIYWLKQVHQILICTGNIPVDIVDNIHTS